MKHALVILILLFSLRVAGQTNKTPELLNYLPICDNNVQFENSYRINDRIVKQSLLSGILTLQLDVYGNCSIADTSWMDYKNDTLFIWTGPVTVKINEGELMITESECDCYFHLFYDIFNLDAIPQTVVFNKNVITQTEQKFLSSEYKLINGNEYLIYDSDGVYYEYSFYENGNIKNIRKEYGQILQLLHYNENEELTEVYFDSRHIENGIQKNIEIK